MRFDAGVWGQVDVDVIAEEGDCVVGIRQAGDREQVLYCNYGKEGCVRVRSRPQRQEPD